MIKRNIGGVLVKCGIILKEVKYYIKEYMASKIIKEKLKLIQ